MKYVVSTRRFRQKNNLASLEKKWTVLISTHCVLLSFLSFSRIAQQLSRPILYGLSLLMGSVFLVMYAFPTTKRLKPAHFAHAHCSNGFPEIYRTQSNTYVLPSLILYYEKKMGGNRVWCSNFAFFFFFLLWASDS